MSSSPVIVRGVAIGSPVNSQTSSRPASTSSQYPSPGVSNAAGAPAKPPPLRRQSTHAAQALGPRGYPPGLSNMLAESIVSFPVRFVIVDNSGSMNAPDGERLVRDSRGVTHQVPSTRWQELGDVIIELAETAQALSARTDFHLLNPSVEGQYISVGGTGAGAGPAVGQVAAPAD